MRKSVLIFLLWILLSAGCQVLNPRIDRYQLVKRHNPELTEVDPANPLSVGNGKFAYTTDITGLQTFPDLYYQQGIPLETLSDWAWHSFPNPEGYRIEDAFEFFDLNGRPVGYPSLAATPAGQWLRANPHRIPLGQIGLDMVLTDGSRLRSENLKNIHQKLDMWRGLITSTYTIENQEVRVETVCHPESDLIAFSLETALLDSGRLKIGFRFPYSYHPQIKNNPPLDWAPDKHYTLIVNADSSRVILRRSLNETEYFVQIRWTGCAVFRQVDAHYYQLSAAGKQSELSFSVQFDSNRNDTVAHDFEETKSRSALRYQYFWMSGGAVDLSGSKDELAQELERRIVLSQYLTRIQCAGIQPPQESGLTLSSWHGKFHTEMVWWHMAHFLSWGRQSLFRESFAWYPGTLNFARDTARQQGLKGARWSKMVGPDGRESPGGNPFIIWNQPHPIYLSEMFYRLDEKRLILETYREIVFETAEYMASYARWDEEKQRYNLGPPVWPVQEIYDFRETENPIFELAYWRYGLELAQLWRERLGLKRNEEWDHVIDHLAPLPVHDSLYVGLADYPCTFTDAACRSDHPSMLMPLGFLPGEGVDREIMRETLHKVVHTWDWEKYIWGWDYPMIAMTAARLGEPKLAVGILCMDAPNNHYLLNGHCPQQQGLPVYLPANGALLSTVAMMAAGWDGAPNRHAPGFPDDGSWKVKWEGLKRMP